MSFGFLFMAWAMILRISNSRSLREFLLRTMGREVGFTPIAFATLANNAVSVSIALIAALVNRLAITVYLIGKDLFDRFLLCKKTGAEFVRQLQYFIGALQEYIQVFGWYFEAVFITSIRIQFIYPLQVAFLPFCIAREDFV